MSVKVVLIGAGGLVGQRLSATLVKAVTMLRDDATMLRDDATMLRDDATMLRDDVAMPLYQA